MYFQLYFKVEFLFESAILSQENTASSIKWYALCVLRFLLGPLAWFPAFKALVYQAYPNVQDYHLFTIITNSRYTHLRLIAVVIKLFRTHFLPACFLYCQIKTTSATRRFSTALKSTGVPWLVRTYLVYGMSEKSIKLSLEILNINLMFITIFSRERKPVFCYALRDIRIILL